MVIDEELIDEDFSSLGVDSISFVKIIVAIEEAFDCEIPDSKLLIKELGTVNKIVSLLKSLI